MKQPKPLVFFGTESFSVASLVSLVSQGWPIELVVTKPDAKSGRGHKLNEPPVKQIAMSHNIKVVQPHKLIDIVDEIKATQADYAVLVAYGKIIPQQIIDLFPGGIINVHPSLLPKYRGPSPIEAAILNGDKLTGISIMKLSAQMDAGPVYYQVEVPLRGDEDKTELSTQLSQKSAEILNSKLNDIVSGNLTAEPQDEKKASYTKLIQKQDGVIDWSKPAEAIEREVRAYAGWPRSQAQIFNQSIIVTKAKLSAQQDPRKLIVETGSGYLEIVELIAPSGRRMSGSDFMRGYQKTSGSVT